MDANDRVCHTHLIKFIQHIQNLRFQKSLILQKSQNKNFVEFK